MQSLPRHAPKNSYSPREIPEGFVELLQERPVLVGTLWATVFVALTVFSWATGIMPSIDRETANAEAPAGLTSIEEGSERSVTGDDAPVRIIIDAIGVDAPIMNPTSRDIDVLDEALRQGVVHYPGSGDLEDTSNMFLLGHSTGFRVVQNDLYKVFNGLKNLQANDVIRVQSGDTEYLYRVTDVALVNATETEIPLSSRTKMLTLATCNVFGAKEERFVVTAEFVGSYPIVDDDELDL